RCRLGRADLDACMTGSMSTGDLRPQPSEHGPTAFRDAGKGREIVGGDARKTNATSRSEMPAFRTSRFLSFWPLQFRPGSRTWLAEEREHDNRGYRSKFARPVQHSRNRTDPHRRRWTACLDRLARLGNALSLADCILD